MKALVITAALLMCSCSTPDPYRISSTSLESAKLSDIATVEFVGYSSPVEGRHFSTTDRAIAAELLQYAQHFKPNAEFINMCGFLTNMELRDKKGGLIAALAVSNDGNLIKLGDPHAHTTRLANDRQFALRCFELLKENAYGVLQQMKQSPHRNFTDMPFETFPFEDIQ